MCGAPAMILGAQEQRSGAHADEELGQSHHGVKAENVFPEEVRCSRTDLVGPIRMQQQIRQEKGKAEELKPSYTHKQPSLRDARYVPQRKWKDRIEKDFHREAPTDG